MFCHGSDCMQTTRSWWETLRRQEWLHEKNVQELSMAEMGDRGHNRHGPKTGDRAPFRGELGPHLTQRRWAKAYLHVKCHLDPSSSLATIDMDRKLGACPLLGEGKLGSHLTQWRFGQGLLPTKWHLHPSSHLATTYGPKIGEGLCPFVEGGDGSPSNTMWPGP